VLRVLSKRSTFFIFQERKFKMRKTLFLSAFFVLFLGFVLKASAQSADVGIKANFTGGEVTSVNAGKIVLQTKDGAIDVVLSDKTEYKRVPPDNPTLKAAVASAFSDIGVGDKILVTGMVSADKKSIPAKAIYLMTKSDISQKQTKEQEQWRSRGITGKIISINPQTKQLTVSVRNVMGTRDVVLSTREKAKFKRYAPDSVSYSEAKNSSFDEINVGDMIRALGDRSEDGTGFTAEEVITGAFQTTAGTITAVNTEKGEITLENIQTKKPVTIVVGKNTVLKQFPAEMAQRMAQFQMMEASGGGGNVMRPPNQQGGQNNPPPGQTPNPMGQGGGGGGMRGGGGSLDDMLERFPNVTIADLKVGEMIAISSTKTANSDRVTAIKLLSGVEPFLKMPQMANGGGGNRQGQGGQNTGFSIPGLDGVGFP
jgi:ribosomal protein L24